MARGKKDIDEPMSLQALVRYLKRTDPYRQSLLHHQQISERPAEFGDPRGGLPSWLSQALKSHGISRLFTHQALAIDFIRQGDNLVLVTPTASGKSLAFNLPILESLHHNKDTCALYLFPLKALEQDQLTRLNELIDCIEVKHTLSAAIYDGDTPTTERARIRKKLPRILITNPDMLHHGIMPYHTKWETLFRQLRFIVIDELHTYRGVFGSHILQIFRRIRRLANFYGSEVQFIAASATIENPRELAESLVGRKFRLIDDSGAPTKKKHFLFFNPQLSPYTEAARLLSLCVKSGLKTIAFTRSRKITELLYSWCIESQPKLRDRISAYRAGFLPEERREIEGQLFSGELDGVISTSALEMGIDIGGLDACILVGYPGTITATWQRGGRVGRKDRESMIALISGHDALDQYFMLNPKDFFSRPCERAVVDADNPEILHQHLVCAAAEFPLRTGDIFFDTEKYADDLIQLVTEKKLEAGRTGKQWFAAKTMPHRDMDIRSMGISFTILAPDNKVIGNVSGRQRYAECHTGAVYLHRGKQYLIHEVDESQRIIHAVQENVDYYTQPQTEKETEILSITDTKEMAGFIINQGRLRVTERITGFQRKRMLGQELIDQVPLDFPPLTFETIGIWIEIEEELRTYLLENGRHYMGSLHGIEHAALSLFPLFALCDRNDVGGICKPHHHQVQKGVIFMYDGHSGGVGLSRRAYEVIDQLLEKTLHLIDSCNCEEGCPSCIHSPKCGSGNKPLDKGGSIRTLQLLLGKDPGDAMVIVPHRLETDAAVNPGKVNQKFQTHEGIIQHKGSAEMEADTPQPLPAMTIFERKERVVVFDLETQKSALDVGGWGNAHLMRVSVGVIYDSMTDSYSTYYEERINELIDHLSQAALVIGYNSLGFDYNVLRGYSGMDFRKLPTLDLCHEIKKAAGKRYSLNDVAKATINEPKSADGLQALTWFKEGKIDLIRKYCEDDVRITRDLFRYALTYSHLFVMQNKGTKNSTLRRISLNIGEKLSKISQKDH